MIGRLTAALPGAIVVAVLLGMAVGRAAGGTSLNAAYAGSLCAMLAWGLLSALAVAQRSGAGAWIVVGAAGLASAAGLALS